RASGLRVARIVAVHIVSVVRAPIVIQSAIVGGIALAVQSVLVFLVLGDINVLSRGSMLSDGFSNLYTSPMLILLPALPIGLTLISLTLLANSLRDELERANAPRKQNRKNKTAPAATAVKVEKEIIRHPQHEAHEGHY